MCVGGGGGLRVCDQIGTNFCLADGEWARWGHRGWARSSGSRRPGAVRSLSSNSYDLLFGRGGVHVRDTTQEMCVRYYYRPSERSWAEATHQVLLLPCPHPTSCLSAGPCSPWRNTPQPSISAPASLHPGPPHCFLTGFLLLLLPTPVSLQTSSPWVAAVDGKALCVPAPTPCPIRIANLFPNIFPLVLLPPAQWLPWFSEHAGIRPPQGLCTCRWVSWKARPLPWDGHGDSLPSMLNCTPSPPALAALLPASPPCHPSPTLPVSFWAGSHWLLLTDTEAGPYLQADLPPVVFLPDSPPILARTQQWGHHRDNGHQGDESSQGGLGGWHCSKEPRASPSPHSQQLEQGGRGGGRQRAEAVPGGWRRWLLSGLSRPLRAAWPPRCLHQTCTSSAIPHLGQHPPATPPEVWVWPGPLPLPQHPPPPYPSNGHRLPSTVSKEGSTWGLQPPNSDSSPFDKGSKY